MNTKTETRETWLTLRISREEQARLAEVARQQGVKVADVVREGLRPILAGTLEAAPAGAGQAMMTR